jgi:luciferase family oxidoreductase group 1
MPDFVTPLSVLDLAPVAQGSTPADALAAALRLAREVERLGYRRYWVAEHHSMPGIASSSPAVLLARVAAETSTIRLGSGGVMLPNHSPLVIAEQFGMLEALEPGRIDLGIGRAPGTDPATAHALRRGAEGSSGDDLPQQLAELLAYFNGGFPERHPYASIQATPGRGYQPAIWLLGSSDYSAELAGRVGLGFAFAQHFASLDAGIAIGRYLENFEPSPWLDEPHAILTVAAVCAETQAEAERLAASSDYGHVRRARGEYGPLVSPEVALAHPWTPEEIALRRANRARLFVGEPAALRDRLSAFAAQVGAHEVMFMSAMFDHAARLRSYELLARAFAS